jgi:mannose-6-phosphate isomerase-like protein (cupin superfamily)
MNTASGQTTCAKHTFRDRTGYILAPWMRGVTHAWVTVSHSASVPPWTDPDVHYHRDSEEYYFLFQGTLELLVDGSLFSLKPYEVLAVGPGVPHAVIGGAGPIEHFVIRMPAADDRQGIGPIPAELPPVQEEPQRELQHAWGCRAPLAEARNQNCWLFGVGQAHFHSGHMCMAHLNFPGGGNIIDPHRHGLHLHRESWEYYVALQGTQTLRVEEELVTVHAGEILEVPPGVKQVLHGRHTPYRGITFRVPRLDDKVEF